MESAQELLRRIYASFNARDIDATLTAMHTDVVWPNGMEGGVVEGHSGIRDYWTRQFTMINPHVEPVDFTTENDGRVAVRVHQVIRDLAGAVLMDRMVEHVYSFRDGLVSSMEIRELT